MSDNARVDGRAVDAADAARETRKTEDMLREALDSADLDLTRLTEPQARKVGAILRILAGVIADARENGGRPLGLIPYHARTFAADILDEDA